MPQSALPSLESTFAAMQEEWLAIRSHSRAEVTRWEQQLANLEREETRLRDEGKWVHGRADFLGVIERYRDELSHSRMIAWLLDPCALHGFGTRVLKSLLEEVFDAPGTQPRLERARTRCEVPLVEGRLDVVVEAPGLYLVIENKVDAEENGQCLYYSKHLRPDALCLLLSPDGRLPSPGEPPLDDCKDMENRFVPMRYSQLASILHRVLRDLKQSSPGRSIAEDYLTTLEIEFDDDRR